MSPDLASGLALAVRPPAGRGRDTPLGWLSCAHSCAWGCIRGHAPSAGHPSELTFSVSGKLVNRPCFRILSLSCDVSSASVHWRLSRSAAIVTQLVTRSPVSTASKVLVITIHSCTGLDVHRCIYSAAGSLTTEVGGGLSSLNFGGCDQSAASLRSTIPPENSALLKRTKPRRTWCRRR